MISHRSINRLRIKIESNSKNLTSIQPLHINMEKLACGVRGCWPILVSSTSTTDIPLLNTSTTTTTTEIPEDETLALLQSKIIFFLVAGILVVEVLICCGLLTLIRRSRGMASERFMSSWLMRLMDDNVNLEDNVGESTRLTDTERSVHWNDTGKIVRKSYQSVVLENEK